MIREPIPTRGAGGNPPNRFEKIHVELDADWDPEQDPLPRTQFFKDHTTTLITYNDSPDVGFEASINPYRGCEHGLIALSGVTDPYQPVERRLKLTRGCLQVLAEFRNPVAIVTKNNLVTRDLDLLAELGGCHAAAVFISLTTLDTELRTIMEPRTSPPAARLAAIRALSQAGIPTGVLVAPVIPGLTDHEIPSLIGAAVEAGAGFAGYVVLRLPYAVAPLFEHWLEKHLPGKKEKVLNRIRALRDGKLNDPKFGSRMRGEGIFAEQINALFHAACRKAGIAGRSPELSTAAFRRQSGRQLSLFQC